MKLQFVKMEGCGNDFVFIDAIRGRGINSLNANQVQQICDRHFGVGADGVVILSEGQGAHAQWKFYNSDGSKAEMCGNAARCAILFLGDRYFPNENVISIQTLSGIVKGKKLGPNLAEVAMVSKQNPQYRYSDKTVVIEDMGPIRTYFIDTGVPHVVVEVDSLKDYPILKVGALIRSNPIFGRQGTNVTFFQKSTNNIISATTYERGVENETLACGTGAVAAASIFSELYLQPLPLLVKVPGGELTVDMSPISKIALLRGAAHYVFEGEYPLGETSQYVTTNRYSDRKIEVPSAV